MSQITINRGVTLDHPDLGPYLADTVAIESDSRPETYHLVVLDSALTRLGVASALDLAVSRSPIPLTQPQIDHLRRELLS